MKEFSSSILRFGPIFTPYRIKIDDKYIVYRRNSGIGFLWLATDEVSLKTKSVTNFIIIDNLFWCDIKIITSSGEIVILKHFTMSDAKQIKESIHS